MTSRRFPLALFWAIVGSISMSAQSPVSNTITIEGPRPLADALLKLGPRFGLALNYADAPVLFAGDAIEAAPAVMTPE